MSETHEVISAFLDNQLFNAEELSEALGDPKGRALLIDFIALRYLTQPEGAVVAHSTSRPHRFSLRRVAAVAAVLVALLAGYLIGAGARPNETVAAPPPTRVVQSQAGWRDVEGGRLP